MDDWLIVTKYVDRDFNETGQYITAQQWVEYVESDDEVVFCQPPEKATDVRGELVVLATFDGASQWIVGDQQLPFMTLVSGELKMPYLSQLDDPDHPLRSKVVQVARHFAALITRESTTEFFDW